MAYTVLARKYRSWTFDELVGQEAVARTLKNAILSGRLHHGYLFCGTRGVGKTSAARVLARSLNCLSAEGPTIDPCRRCESCTAIAEGQDVDVIEIDAASNTGVDNIRELRSNTVYRPARARFKIYIIDEVHMLSTGAFNALLKTLEEPPAHVKFIMATTEPQKVPATIQSRCLRFDFRSIGADRIAAHLAWIVGQEGVQADERALRRVARLANGSMRDALSLLDQLMSIGGERITPELIEDILPSPHDELLTRMIGCMADRDAAGALATLDECLNGGHSLERLAELLADQVRTLMILKICGPDSGLVDLPAGGVAALNELAGRFDAEAYVYMIAVLEELRRTVRSSSLGRAVAEAALVRLCSDVTYASVRRLLEGLGEAGTAPGATPSPVSAAGPGRSAASPAARGGGQHGEARPEAPPEARSAPCAAAAPPVPAEASRPRAASGPFRPAVRPPESNDEPAPGGRPRSAASPRGGPSAADLKAAASEPVVREALDLFEGTLVNVERPAPPHPDKPPA